VRREKRLSERERGERGWGRRKGKENQAHAQSFEPLRGKSKRRGIPKLASVKSRDERERKLEGVVLASGRGVSSERVLPINATRQGLG